MGNVGSNESKGNGTGNDTAAPRTPNADPPPPAHCIAAPCPLPPPSMAHTHRQTPAAETSNQSAPGDPTTGCTSTWWTHPAPLCANAPTQRRRLCTDAVPQTLCHRALPQGDATAGLHSPWRGRQFSGQKDIKTSLSTLTRSEELKGAAPRGGRRHWPTKRNGDAALYETG